MLKRTAPNTSPADVRSFRTFEDASGAPAVIAYNGYVFAFDLLGEIKVSCIGPKSGSRAASKIALALCQTAYVDLLATLPADYIARNREVYS